jgi:lysine/ornithine N-monooxygenase
MTSETNGFTDAENMELADYLAAFEAQEVIIREGGKVVQGLKDELAQERKMRQAFETLYNAKMMGPREKVAADGRLTEAREATDKLLSYLETCATHGEGSLRLSVVASRAAAILEALG